MRRTPWATYLWPGLPQLWTAGAWGGLAVALGFGLLLNLLILVTFLWVELVVPPVIQAGWLALAIVWIGAAVMSWREPQISGEIASEGAQDLFPAALVEYLQGNWFEAETLLGKLLRTNPRDAEARLMLATLLRHVGRREESRDQLTRLQRQEAAGRWAPEIAAELRFLEVDQAVDKQPEAQAADDAAQAA